jgi:hypothetical protein
MVYSQAVLEHVNDLARTLQVLHLWLKPDGFMSHEIDFKCHGTAKEWNGHWACPDLLWRLVQGKRPYLLNRQPCSIYTTLLQKVGFEIVCEMRTKTASRIRRKDLAKNFRNMSDDDLTTSSCFIQALKK